MKITWLQGLGIGLLVAGIQVLFPHLDEWRRIIGAGLLAGAIGFLAEDWVSK